ncbi:hypothetical protein [Streptomyces sp. IBSBF 3136]|uniref:hypothetical protein n=1 Tax=Streptomyces sp. IBSBF 3136 TaxID=2903524 RepID=UPI002FDBD748
MRDPKHDDRGPGPASAVRRLASWLRRRSRPEPSHSAPPDPPAVPPSRLRPQPEDDASVYPLF